jgi:hypothetical protein
MALPNGGANNATENRSVGGSIPPLGTIEIIGKSEDFSE